MRSLNFRKSTIWMTRCSGALCCLLFLLTPPAFAMEGATEDSMIKAYVHSLLKGDLNELDALLAPDFEYEYSKSGVRKKLSRAEEIKSVRQLFKDAAAHVFNNLERFNRVPSKEYNVQFVIIFEDSPKVDTDSQFRGTVLDIDERLAITIENNKIRRIVEMVDRNRKNKLSFGFLKSLHLGNVASDSVNRGNELIIRLIDTKSHEPLLIKKIIEVNHEYVTERYYWPNNAEVANFE